MKKSRTSVKKATFQSYITDGNALGSSGGHIKGISDLEEDGEDAEAGPPQPHHLPGELTVSQAEQVLRYTPYGDHKQGISGTLFCTNFKVTFITPNRPVNKVSTQRNRLVGENDIVLNNIDTVYQVSHGRRKKLFPTSGLLGHVKHLEVHCKDFRVHSFSFKFTQKNEAKQVVNAIVHHAFPTRLELLFAFDYAGDTTSTEVAPRVPRYKLVEDWETEVERLGAAGYKATTCNKAFRIASSLPECLVVPRSLDNAVIGEAAPQFVEYRIPVWSYTHPGSGASLVRMADTIPEGAHRDVEEKMLSAIALSHISLKRPVVHDLSKLPVTLSDIQTSHEKLRELCMPSSRKEMLSLDANWFSRLEDTRWISIVAICLQSALRVVEDLIDKMLTVVIKEESCSDLAPVISCLVQLLVDPVCRSLHGFQTLVEREWVALGHHFADRCGLVTSPDTEQCPVFLLFLDCCWQLLQQFPSAFQFSEVYLAVLWDTVCLGLFDNFIFNCARQRIVSANKFSMYPGTSPAAKLMSAWDWAKQFSEEELTLFNNPLYLTRVQLKRFMSKVMPGSNRGHYRMTLGDLDDGVDVAEDADGVLRPGVHGSCLKFWSYCYLRWLTPVEIIGGGTPSVYIQQCILVEEIICLQHKIDSLERSTQFVKSRRPKSDLFFSFECNPSVNARKWSKFLTSSFPFVPDTQRNSGSPLSLYMERSNLCESDDSLDELSEDEMSQTPDRSQNHADPVTPSDRGHADRVTPSDRGHADPVTPSDRGHADRVTPSDRGHADRVTPGDRGHADRVTPGDRGHADISTPSDRGHADRVTPSDRGHADRSTPSDGGHAERSAPSDRGHADRVTPSDGRRHLANDIRGKDTGHVLQDTASPRTPQTTSSGSPRHPDPRLLPRHSPYKVSDGHIVYADASPDTSPKHTPAQKAPVDATRTRVNATPLADVGHMTNVERSAGSGQGERKESVDHLFTYFGWKN